jgi:hypothetical protein
MWRLSFQNGVTVRQYTSGERHCHMTIAMREPILAIDLLNVESLGSPICGGDSYYL